MEVSFDERIHQACAATIEKSPNDKSLRGEAAGQGRKDGISPYRRRASPVVGHSLHSRYSPSQVCVFVSYEACLKETPVICHILGILCFITPGGVQCSALSACGEYIRLRTGIIS